MNEEGLQNVKKGLTHVEGLTDRFLSRTNVLLDEISILTQALGNSQPVGTSLSATATVAQLANSIVRQI